MQVQKTPAGSTLRLMIPNVLQQCMNAAISRGDWDRSLAMIDRLMTVGSPSPAASLGSVATASLSITRARAMRAMSPNSVTQYPIPSNLLDSTRFYSLNQAHQALKGAGQADRLGELLDRRAKEAEGPSRQSWLLARSAFDWWEGEKDASLAALEQAAAMTPADLDLVMLRSKALAAHGDLKEALAVLAPLRVPFGTAAKTLEQTRLQLAQRTQDEEVSRQAALRLFAMRLDANEQVQLAQTLRRLGLTSQGQQLDQKAELMARSNPSMMLNLMQQYSQTDPVKAASLARSILQQVKRGGAGGNNQNNSIRIAALRQLKETGELEKRITHADEQLMASPGSAALLDDLFELHSAANDEAKLLELIRKMLVIRPDDASLRQRAAQILLRRGRHLEVVEMIDPLWEKSPEQAIQQVQMYVPSYVRSGRLDDLVGKLQKLKGNPQLAQFQWALNNLAQGNGLNGLKVDDAIKIYRVTLDLLPPDQRDTTNTQFADYLARNGRKTEAYEVYKAAAFALKAPPRPEVVQAAVTKMAPPAAPVTATPKGIVTRTTLTGAMSTLRYEMPQTNAPGGLFTRVVDLAIELGRQDELAAEARKAGAAADWKFQGEVICAMIARRQKDESPLESLALRAQKDADVISHDGAQERFYQELAACQGRPALIAAIGLWERGPGGKQALEDAPMARRRRMADAWIKLGDRARARETLLAPTRLANVGAVNLAAVNQAKVQEWIGVAQNLNQLEFSLDALTLYSKVVRDPQMILSGNQGNYQLQQVQGEASQCVAALLKADRSETLKALTDALGSADVSEALARFFLVVDAQSLRNQRMAQVVDSSVSRKVPYDRTSPQLILALLEFAKQNSSLDAIAAKVAEIRARPGADSLRLQAFAALLAMAADRPSESQPIFDLWDKIPPDVKRKTDWASQPETWLVFREAMRHDPSRAWGRSVAATFAAGADRAGNPGRSAAIISMLADPGDSPADEAAISAVIAASKGNTTAPVELAKIRVGQKRNDEAIALLNRAWRVNPNAMASNLAELINLYTTTGRFDALGDGLRLVQDANVRQQATWQVSNQISAIFGRLRKPEDLFNLYVALSDVLSDDNGANLKSQFVQAFAQLPHNPEALGIYRRLIFPVAKRNTQAWEFERPAADLARELGAIDALQSECDKTMADHPAWRPQGEFLKALLAARKGDEQPLVAMAEKRLKDPAFALATAAAMVPLRDELSEATSGAALRAAIGIWQAPQNPNQANRFADNSGTNVQSHIAGLWIKLGDREKARAVLMDLLKAVSNATYPVNARNPQNFEMTSRQQVAAELARHGFLLDAISVYDSIHMIERLEDGNQNNSDPPEVAAQAVVRKVLAMEADETIAALESALKSEAKPPDLAPFVAVFDDPNRDEVGNRSGEPSWISSRPCWRKRRNRAVSTRSPAPPPWQGRKLPTNWPSSPCRP